MRGPRLSARSSQASVVPVVLALVSWKGRVCMRAPYPAEERTPRVSQVVAEALVRRQGPLKIVTRASRLGIPPTLTRALVVACGASALDSRPGLPSRRSGW
jgi:hypothetical protein